MVNRINETCTSDTHVTIVGKFIPSCQHMGGIPVSRVSRVYGITPEYEIQSKYNICKKSCLSGYYNIITPITYLLAISLTWLALIVM